jgi:hypothetical protein
MCRGLRVAGKIRPYLNVGLGSWPAPTFGLRFCLAEFFLLNSNYSDMSIPAPHQVPTKKQSHRTAVASSDVPRGTQSPRAPLTPDPAGIRWLNVPRGTPTRPEGSNSWPADGFDTLHRSTFHVEHSLFLILTPGKSAFCVAFRDRFSTFLPFSSPSCSKFTSAPSPARYRVYPAEPPPLPAAFHNCVPVLHRRNPLRRPVRSP